MLFISFSVNTIGGFNKNISKLKILSMNVKKLFLLVVIFDTFEVLLFWTDENKQ